MMKAGDDQEQLQVEITKIKWPESLKTLELMGKLTRCGAFKDKVEHSGELQVSTIITEIQQQQSVNRQVLPNKK